MARAKRAGVVLSVQPAFNYLLPHQTYGQYIGRRLNRVDPLGSLLRAGIPLVGGSDSTVTPLSPMLGIHSAVNHSRASERLSVAEAIHLFTQDAAYGTFDEHRRGRLEPGWDADFAILDEDPFSIDPAGLEALEVLMTVCRGEVVFEA
jgi:predicted amidohydrolase YtcJ